MMTQQERIAALKNSGYSPAQAEFLALAALTSGYFFRWQFAEWYGSNSQAETLIVRLTESGHARVMEFPGRKVYHLTSAAVYGAVGQPNSRNRREHSIQSIKSRVMGLDYLLTCVRPQATEGAQPLLTEDERVDYFTRALGHPVQCLPSGRVSSAHRLFPDRFPLLRDEDGTVTFAYVDEGQNTVAGFISWLERHRSLFAVVRKFRVVYVCCFPDLAEIVRRRFNAFIGEVRGAAADETTKEALKYFETKLEMSRRATTMDVKSLNQFRDAAQRFSGPEWDALYSRWQVQGALAFSDNSVTFETHALAHDYTCFGTAMRGRSRFLPAHLSDQRRASQDVANHVPFQQLESVLADV